MSSRTILISAIFLATISLSTVGSVKLEPFHSFAHGLKSGPVELTDTQITIPDFHYDGTGPEPYFIVGNCSEKFRFERPDPKIVSTRLADENGSTAKLGKYTGQTITLSLPTGKTWRDYDFITVYCVPYNHNFGYVEIKQEILYPNECPKTNSTSTTTTGTGISSNCRSCPASAHSTWEFRSFTSFAILLPVAIFTRWLLTA